MDTGVMEAHSPKAASLTTLHVCRQQTRRVSCVSSIRFHLLQCLKSQRSREVGERAFGEYTQDVLYKRTVRGTQHQQDKESFISWDFRFNTAGFFFPCQNSCSVSCSFTAVQSSKLRLYDLMLHVNIQDRLR